MQDNAIIEIFRPIIINGLISAGYPSNIAVKESNQPTQQGVPEAPTIFFTKIGDHRYGFPRNDTLYSGLVPYTYRDNTVYTDRNGVPYISRVNSNILVQTETQYYETTFQVNALAIQDPTVISFTASDLVNVVAAILQRETTVTALSQQDLGILRITNVRNPYFMDDKGRNEAIPSFDFVILHKMVTTFTPPVIESISAGIYGV